MHLPVPPPGEWLKRQPASPRRRKSTTRCPTRCRTRHRASVRIRGLAKAPGRALVNDQLRIRLAEQIDLPSHAQALAGGGVKGQPDFRVRRGARVVAVDEPMCRSEPDKAVLIHAHAEQPQGFGGDGDGMQIERRRVGGGEQCGENGDRAEARDAHGFIVWGQTFCVRDTWRCRTGS